MFGGDRGCKWSNKLVKREIWQGKGGYSPFEKP